MRIREGDAHAKACDTESIQMKGGLTLDLTNLTPLEMAKAVFLFDFTFWLVRYAVFAALAFAFVYFIARQKFGSRAIQKTNPSRDRLWKEVGWSVSTLFVFALMAILVVLLMRAGLTRRYNSISDYGWGYYLLSWILFILAHDAYFYWAHRFMHWKPIFRYVHAVHHSSTNPSPLAAFAFHPLEAVVEYAFFIPMIMILPLHISITHTYPSIMLLLNVYAHLGYEFLPRAFASHPIGRWVITATLHNQHHKKFRVNYGLWFYWWDRWFGTIDPAYETEFRANEGPVREKLENVQTRHVTVGPGSNAG